MRYKKLFILPWFFDDCIKFTVMFIPVWTKEIYQQRSTYLLDNKRKVRRIVERLRNF